jgi:hypothetical protein
MSPITSQMTSNTAVSLVAGNRPVRVDATSIYRAITGSGRTDKGPGLTGRHGLAALNVIDFIVIFLLSKAVRDAVIGPRRLAPEPRGRSGHPGRVNVAVRQTVQPPPVEDRRRALFDKVREACRAGQRRSCAGQK